MSLTRRNMNPKAPSKPGPNTMFEVDPLRDGDEYSDGRLSQDEESYGRSSTSTKTLAPSSKTSAANKVKKNPQASSSSPQKQIRHGLSTKGLIDRGVMTDPVDFNQVNQGGVITRVFIIQLVILIGVLVAAMVGYTIYFTSYIKDLQVRQLKESLDHILYVSDSGQRFVDKTINDKMSVRIPVLLSNGTPTVIDDEVNNWVDSYIRENVIDSVKARIQEQHKHMVEQSCDNKVEELVDERIAAVSVDKTVNDKLIPNIEEIINNNSPQLIDDRMEVLLSDSIKEKVLNYTDKQVELQRNEAFETSIAQQDTKSLFDETLKDFISEYVKANTPSMINEYTSREDTIAKMNVKLRMMIGERFKDIPVVIDETLMTEKWKHQINKYAESLLEQESDNLINSNIKNGVETVVNDFGGKAKKFQDDLDVKRKQLTEEIDRAEKTLDELRKPQQDSRLDRQDNINNVLTVLMIVLMFCMYWMYYRLNTERSTNQHGAVSWALDYESETSPHSQLFSPYPTFGFKNFQSQGSVKNIFLTRRNMDSKTSTKPGPNASYEADPQRDRDEYSDKCLSQDEDSERKGQHDLSSKSDVDRGVMTDPVYFNQVNQGGVITRVFIIQLVILIGVILVAVVGSYIFLTNYITDLQKIQKDLDVNRHELTKEMHEAEKIQKNLDVKGQELTKEIHEAEKHRDYLKKNLDELKELLQDSRLGRQENINNVLTMLMIVLMFCMYWMYYSLTQNTEKSTNQHEAVTRDPFRPVHFGPKTSLNKPNQENSGVSGTCIILFNGRLREEIKKLVTDLKMPDLKYDFHVINRHEDIARLPRHKVYLMCSEFTERHVIIEPPGLGLGDLHRKTYDKVMEISGNLIILYIHDPESRKLRDEYYNDGIYCVKSQPELSGLRDLGCFFSIYKDLTRFQVNKLKEKLTEYLK